jgi:hypothetical protein
MMLRKGLATATVTLLLSSAAWAQTSTSGGTTGSTMGTSTSASGGSSGGTTTSTTATPTGAFAALSPGNQTIVRALFEAQTPPMTTTTTTAPTSTSTGSAASTTSTGSTTPTPPTGTSTTSSPTPLTLDQIAALKGHEGWGRVFKEMKADGLVQAKNLGQVVSNYKHEMHVSAGTTTRGTTVVTSGNGRTLASNAPAHSGVTAGSGSRHGRWSGSGNDDNASVATVTNTAMSVTHGSAMEGGHGGAASYGGGSAHGH